LVVQDILLLRENHIQHMMWF